MRLLSSLLFVVAVAGCGGGNGYGGSPSGPTGPSGPSGATSNATVSIRGETDIYGDQSFSFSPLAVTIVRNGTVTWNNTSATVHNVTFAAAAGAPANIPDHVSGATSRTFTTAGTFNYSCTQHAGMNGQVVVQ